MPVNMLHISSEMSAIYGTASVIHIDFCLGSLYHTLVRLSTYKRKHGVVVL